MKKIQKSTNEIGMAKKDTTKRTNDITSASKATIA